MPEKEKDTIVSANNWKQGKKAVSSLDVLRIFINNPKKEFVMKEIQKKLSLSYEPTHRYVNKLLNKKYIVS